MIDLSKMNPQQRDAVLTTEGPLLVLAGAGSGKTRVLTHRVAHLVLDRGVDPENVLAITFTNKATKEMKERIHTLVGRDAAFIKVGTFHRTCLDVLRSYHDLVDLPPKFGLCSPDDAKKIITRLCSSFKAEAAPEPGPTMALISRAKNELVSPAEMLRRAEPKMRVLIERVAQVYAEYDEHLQKSKVIDLDDVLVECHRLLRDNPTVLAGYHDLFRYIHVDEYQDTCHAQYEIVRLLAGPVGTPQNLMVVGDPNQSIYAFRAANVENILSFEKDYPRAKVVALSTNYRSTPNILSAASALIAHNRGRRVGALTTPNPSGSPVRLLLAPTEREEAEGVVAGVRGLIRTGTSPADIAVLYRVATLSHDLETAFLRAGIKYEVVRGTRYVDRKSVRDALAYLTSAVHPEDLISLRRISNVPRRGLGDVTYESVEKLAVENDVPLREALVMAGKGQLPLPPKGRAAVGDLVSVLNKVQVALTTARPLPDRIRSALEATGLLSQPLKGDAADSDSAGDILKLVDIADALVEEKPDADVTDLLDALALQSEADESTPDSRSKVKLLTVHASKGLEFHSVFVVGVEDGILPHRRAFMTPDPKEMEEERRLAYVAMTRAKTNLTLSTVQLRRMFGERKPMAPSMFLREIPDLKKIRT